MKTAIFIVFIFSIALPFSSHAQISFNNNVTPQQLAQLLVADTTVAISNVTMICPQAARGTFNCSNCNLGLANGVVLSNGLTSGIIGPNNGHSSNVNGVPGDDDIDNTDSDAESADACKLEFDIKITGNTLQLEYVFGSEDYSFATCKAWEDKLAFFITGPGFSYPKNFALVPGTLLPVSVNTINSGTPGPTYSGMHCQSLYHSQYFINNGNEDISPQNIDSFYIRYDGFTTVLTAICKKLSPGVTYHVKLVISDYLGFYDDSGVFLKAGSLRSTVQGNDGPSANIDNRHTNQATPLISNITANDADLDGDLLCITQLWGSPFAAMHSCSWITYTPDSTYYGIDTFYYIVCEQTPTALCDTGMVIVNNQREQLLFPKAEPDQRTILQGTDTIVWVTYNDLKANTNNTFCMANAYSASGRFSANDCDYITYHTDSSFTGKDTGYYVICDNSLLTLCDTTTFIITVLPVPSFYPKALNDTLRIQQANDTLIQVTLNDIAGATGNSFCIANMYTNNGKYSIAGCNSIAYNADTLFRGTEIINYIICDNSLVTVCDTAKLVVIVGKNPALYPVALPDFFFVGQTEDSTLYVTINDSAGITGNTVCVSTLYNNSDHKFSISDCNHITYTQNNDLFTGTDTVRYVICDNRFSSFCDTALLKVGVLYNSTIKPIAINDTATIQQAQSIVVNVGNNDYVPAAGNTFCLSSISGTGGFSIVDCNHIQYLPPVDFTGIKTCSYLVCNDAYPTICDNANLIVRVVPDSSLLPNPNYTSNITSTSGCDVVMQGPTYQLSSTSTNNFSVKWTFRNIDTMSVCYEETTLFLDNPIQFTVADLFDCDETYSSFEYCLTEYNQYGSNTKCDTVCNVIWGSVGSITLSDIFLYPNPTINYITLDMSNNNDEITRTYAAIEVYNIMGAKQKAFTRSDNSKTVNLNVTELPQGIYVTTLLGADGDRRVLGKFTKE